MGHHTGGVFALSDVLPELLHVCTVGRHDAGPWLCAALAGVPVS